jgi:hypothetical protein
MRRWLLLFPSNFFNTYVRPFANASYYNKRHATITSINDQYGDNPDYKYKRNPSHNEQAGLINRLCDVAFIEEGMNVYMPEVNRQIHIGFYGKNRQGR